MTLEELVKEVARVAAVYNPETKGYEKAEESEQYIKEIADNIRKFTAEELERLKKEPVPVPKHSYFETIYHCGSEPTWKVGDRLAYYMCYSNCEGEYMYGKVSKVEYSEEFEDWEYTFEGDIDTAFEAEMISNDTYRKNTP